MHKENDPNYREDYFQDIHVAKNVMIIMQKLKNHVLPLIQNQERRYP